MGNQRLLWFQDGIKLGASQEKWCAIDTCTQDLVEKIGHPDFEHGVVDPMDHLQTLADQLPRDATCVIDLTAGKMGHMLQDVFADSTLREDFHISRLRVVSSPRLDGSGFLLNKPIQEFAHLSEEMDLSRPVILDDVGWSGRSVLGVCQLMRIQIPDTVFGFITCNSGRFGPKPGAKGCIEQMGGRVVSGSFVETPTDDGFHVADFFNITQIDQKLFDLLTRIQETREDGIQFPQNANNNERILGHLLREGKDILFPDALTSQQVAQLERDGRVVGMNGVHPDALFKPNPLNWLLPSFSKRVRSDDIRNNREGILTILNRLNSITKEGSSLGVEGRMMRKEVLI